MHLRRAKIVCTIGPASESPEVLRDLVDAGMDVARLNFSHGTHEAHGRRIDTIRAVADAAGRPIAILQDLCGPKIRCGELAGGSLEISIGDRLVLVSPRRDRPSPYLAGEGELVVRYDGLRSDLRRGDRILLDDGRVELVVDQPNDEGVETNVVVGGALRDNVGCHLPAERLRVSALTDKDKRDLAFGLSRQVDYVALSFTRSAADVLLLKEICDAWGLAVPVVAKIETPQAMAHLESIMLAADAVMVARGDLGVELSPERVPVMQRKILSLGRRHSVPVIVATEMMQSMLEAKRPTRAEASDVATAVFDGADAVMLSGETAVGAHPSLVVRTMSQIIMEAESSPFHEPLRAKQRARFGIPEAVARSACSVAEEVEARVLVAFTETGQTARFASNVRPSVPIVALSPNVQTLRRLSMLWGVVPWYVERLRDSEEMIDRAHALLLAHGIVSPGDRFVTIYGAPVGVSGTTNAIQVRMVG